MLLYIKHKKALGLVVSDKSREDFCKLHYQNLFFDPVTYLCNQSEPFGPFLLSLVKFPLAVQDKKSFEVILIYFNVKL